MSLSAPCFQLSTTTEYYAISSLFLFTFTVMFTQEVNILLDEGFVEQGCSPAMLTCAVRPSFFACFTACSSPLCSSFQSYSCGSESGGHPGGKERLLHCHEWRGHALQLGKLGLVLLKHLCGISLCVHVYYFVHPTAAITTLLSSQLDLSTHQICPCVAV